MTLADVPTEDAAREIVADLNARIVDARRRGVDGPPLLIGTVDVEGALAAWRKRRHA
jgi:hypothetical protein